MPTMKCATDSWRSNILFAAILIICGIFPFVSMSVSSHFPPNWQLMHEAFHAVIETLGCVMALGIAGFLLMRQGQKGNAYMLWPACSMLSMAILDAFHASVSPGREFVFLHSTAQLTGGVFIALIWLPERFAKGEIGKQLPKFVAGACALFGIGSFLFPDIIPTMTNQERFANIPLVLNLLGGILFFAGVAYFAHRFSRDQDTAYLLFIAYCLMFAVAGLTFRLSVLWGVGWWLSHMIRLAAYIVAFGYVSINATAEYLRLIQTEEAVTRLAALVESSDDAIIGRTLDGTIVSWNQGAANLFGYSAEEAHGQKGEFLIPPERTDEETKIIEKIRNGHRDHYFETIRRKKNGTLMDVALSISPVEDSHGDMIGISVIARDITERKKAELEREQLNKNLKLAVGELQRTNRELQEFAHIAAHDLKTPLRAITSLTNWLLTDYSDRFDEQGKEQVQLLVVKAKQMASLIDDILQYCRLGRENLEKKEVDLNAVVSDVIEVATPPEHIEVIVEDALPAILCKKTHIIQIFQNLISNAVKYIDKPNGRVRVGCAEQDDAWVFSVADNGPGIDPMHFERIFQMFQTLSPREGVDSTGVGLAIVKKLVELNGGKVWIKSKIGEGSTFFFTVPKEAVTIKTMTIEAVASPV
jgi:two-component system sensor kinase FixL